MAHTDIDLFDDIGPDVELLESERRKLRRWFGSDLPLFVRPTRYGYSGSTAQWTSWAEEIEVHADAAEAANDLRASRRWARIAGQLYAIVVDTYVAHAEDSSIPAVKALPFEERAVRCHRRGNTKEAFIGRASEFLLRQLQFDPERLHAISFELHRLATDRDNLVGMPRVTLEPAQSVRFVTRLRQSATLQRLYVSPSVAYDISIQDIRFESTQTVREVSVPGAEIPGALFDANELDDNILAASGRTGDTFLMTVSNVSNRSVELRMATVWRAGCTA